MVAGSMGTAPRAVDEEARRRLNWHRRWLKTANKRLLDHPPYAAGFKPNSLSLVVEPRCSGVLFADQPR
jgi:hypothetical protein